MELTSIIGFVLIMTIGAIVIDKFVKKMNRQTTDDETVDEIPKTEDEQKEDVSDYIKKIQATGIFSMKNTFLRRIVKFIIFFFILGFSVVMEKTIGSEGLSETSGFDARTFNNFQPYYSFTIVAFLLWFLIYSKWANEKIWIREKSKNIKSDDIGNNKTSGITKEEAIVKLKELKVLLDLQVITQEFYDKEKVILSPIILDKKTRTKEEKSDELIDDKYLSFIKRIKNYIIGAYVLGLVWTIGNNGSETSIYDLIIQPLVIALFVLLVSIVSYFITLSFSKKEENAFKVFKMIYNTLLTIIILVVVFSFIGKT